MEINVKFVFSSNGFVRVISKIIESTRTGLEWLEIAENLHNQ